MFVNYFLEFEINPSVLALHPSVTDDVKDSFMLENMNEVNVHYARCLSKRFSKALKVGDLGLRMLPFLFQDLRRVCRKEKVDIILFLVPPWYMLLIAPFFSKVIGIPYIIDYIDPWVAKRKIQNSKALFLRIVSKLGEGITARYSKGIVAVSRGICDGLDKRHPNLCSKHKLVLPYGVDIRDLDQITFDNGKIENRDVTLFRYVGAISDAMIPIVDILLAVLKRVSKKYRLRVEFIGTSYGDKKEKLDQVIKKNECTGFVTENPERVSYKDALIYTKSSDITFVVGDTTKYYAASKLMGLIAAQVKFFVFAHEDSFPYQLLKEIDYKYVSGYNSDSYSSELCLDNLYNLLLRLIEDDNYKPIDYQAGWFQEYTAKGMVKKMCDFIKEIK